MFFVIIFGNKKLEVEKFLSRFYNTSINLDSSFWKKEYSNPVEITEIIGTYVDNSDNFSLTMLICLDNDVYIHINDSNADDIIKYIYERFPY